MSSPAEPTGSTDFTMSIPNGVVGDVIECLCLAGGYTLDADPTVNAANAKLTVIAFITQTVQNVKQSQATVAPPVIPPITGLS